VNIGVMMVISLAFLWIGYRVYSRLVARWVGVNDALPTPAARINDGNDYVPTKPWVLFGHHFASIAAAGPIVGPTLALLYGYLPGWLWIMLGVILIGAVHDFTSLMVTTREGGHSVAEVARRTLGPLGFIFYVLFAILLCILVGAVFLRLAATALTTTYPLSELGLSAGSHLLRIERATSGQYSGQLVGHLGGIASTSVVVMTILAPLMGSLLHSRRLTPLAMSGFALGVVALSVAIGFRWPIAMDPNLWIGILLVYVFFAAYLPVWIILQPRDFVNVHLLYIGMGAMVLGVIACGLHGVTLSAPTMNVAEASKPENLGLMWPFLFVTIACGACSGAHGLVSGGTTCKQLAREGDARPIGYGAMLMEAVLAILVLLMVGGALGFEKYKALAWPTVGQANLPLAFAAGVGATLQRGFSIPSVFGTIFGILLLEGFLLTTVDTLMRLSRYLFEEFWSAVGLQDSWMARQRVVNALGPVLITAYLAFTNQARHVWPVFGSANQMMAALTLMAVTAWLARNKRPIWFVAWPAAFMTLTTMGSMALLLLRYFQQGKWALFVTDILLLGLAAGVLVLVMTFYQHLKDELRRPPRPATVAGG